MCTPVQARSDSSEWQDKWQHAVKELAEVKERAWTLLEEKDVQLQALKVPHVALKFECHCPGLLFYAEAVIMLLHSINLSCYAWLQDASAFAAVLAAMSCWCLLFCCCNASIVLFSPQHGKDLFL